MFEKMRKLLPILIVALIAISSCKYEKLLKSSDYSLKYNKALEYYEEEDYMRADGLFEQLKPVLKGTSQADTVFFYSAYCNYHQGNYLLAAYYFDEFRRTYGNSHFVEEAEFMNAYCNYKLSPRPSLDQGNTYQAISLFALYMSRYPNSDRIDECVQYVKELRNKLAEKSFNSAKLYYDLGDYKAAVVAFNNCLDEFPNSKYREDIMYLILKSRFLLAEYSIEEKKTERYQQTVDEYYSFVGEFPESEHYEESVTIFNKSQSHLKN